jgi:hypothetical protein
MLAGAGAELSLNVKIVTGFVRTSWACQTVV